MKINKPSLSRPGAGIFSLGRRPRCCSVSRKTYRINNCSGFAVLLALMLLSACSANKELSADVSIKESESSGITLNFSADYPVSGLQILDSNEQVVFSQQLPALRNGEIVLPLNGEKGEFSLVLFSDPGKSFEKKFRLEGNRRAITGIRSPFQSENETDLPLLLTPSSTAPLIFTFDPKVLQAESFKLNITSDGPLLVGVDAQQWSDELIVEKSSESTELEKFHNFFLRIPPDTHPSEYRLMAEFLPLNGRVENSLRLEKKVIVVDEETLSTQIAIDSVVMPTSREGKENGGLRSDHLVLSGSGRRAGNRGDEAALGLRYPLSYETVVAHNRFEFPVAVVLSSQVLDSNRLPVESFQVPPSLPGPLVQVAAILPASGSARVTLPVYGDQNSAEQGEYIRKIEMVLAGTDIILDRVEAGLTVERPAELALTVTLIVAGLAVLSISLILLRGNRLHSGFTTRQTVLTGLFAAATVVLVNVPVYLLTSITVVVLGPMGFLVDGLLSEFVFFALLVALVSIVPRQGVCATVIGIRFLLGGMLLGMVTPVGILYATLSAIALELALWITRRGGRIGEQLPIRSVMLFASANALISWTGFQFAIVLFRLHYAQWYIFLSVLIGGFVYALLGSLVGRRIGARLARAIP